MIYANSVEKPQLYKAIDLCEGLLRHDSPKPDKALFDMIDDVIRKEKLYTNVNLQRQDIPLALSQNPWDSRQPTSENSSSVSLE